MEPKIGMKMTIKSKLIISYVTIAIFITVSLLVTSNFMLEKQFQQYVKENQEQINLGIVAQLSNQYATKGELSESFLLNLGESALDKGIVLMVNDAQGKEIFCMSCLNTMECENMISAMEQTMKERYPHWKGEYTEKHYDIKSKDVFYGTAVLGYYGPFYYNAQDIEFIKMLNQIFLIVSAVFLFIAVGLGALMANIISRPVKNVIQQTSEIGKGKYHNRISATSNIIELDQLVSSVNDLANILELQQRIKKRMAGDFAHEFRTPLTSLQINMEGMIDGVLDASKDRLEGCHDEILRLTRMVSDIDKLVEIESQSLILNKTKFNLNSLVESILIRFEGEAKQKNISFEFESPQVELEADKDKISQVFVNLISNAVKYTDSGTIKIKFSKHKDSVEISISDTGIGIAKEDIPNIFEYLYRSDQSRSRNSGGSGIGLSIVNSIVLAHGGSIKVESELGKGSNFIINL